MIYTHLSFLYRSQPLSIIEDLFNYVTDWIKFTETNLKIIWQEIDNRMINVMLYQKNTIKFIRSTVKTSFTWVSMKAKTKDFRKFSTFWEIRFSVLIISHCPYLHTRRNQPFLGHFSIFNHKACWKTNKLKRGFAIFTAWSRNRLGSFEFARAE